jgi:hypothetical protein
VPRGTGQPHKEQHRDVNEEDGVEHGRKDDVGQHDDQGEDSTHAISRCVDETRRWRTRSPLAAGRTQTKPDEGDDEGKDEAEGESRRRKTKTKTETRRRRRRRIPEKPDACLPQANQIRRESRRRCQILRRRIPRNRSRNPATTGTLFRSHLVWALHPGAGLHAGRSTPLVNVVLRRGIPSMREDPRAIRHHSTRVMKSRV